MRFFEKLVVAYFFWATLYVRFSAVVELQRIAAARTA